MSFKSEASKVKANRAAGNYKEKTDVFAGFFDELTYGLKKQDEAKRQEDLEKKREKRANDREILKRQKEQDRLEQSQNRLANLYFTTTGQDKTAQNKSSVLSIIKDGGINSYSDLVKVMDDTSSYTEGRTQQDIDDQMSELQTNLSEDGALFNAAKDKVDQTTTEGTIEFGRQDKKVLSMALDEVLFELSSENLSEDRKQELERRRKSLQPDVEYVPTTLYKDDGSEVKARTQTEEALYIGEGYSLVKPGDATDFKKRTLYKEGAKVEVYSKAELDTHMQDGWSNVEPAAVQEFVVRDVYKEGASKKVYSQIELNEALEAGFTATKFDKAEKINTTLYKDGATVVVNTAEEFSLYAEDGWSKVKPKAPEKFVQRTLYDENGSERTVINQEEFDAAITDGFSITKGQNKNFVARDLYHADGRKQRVFDSTEYENAIQDGFTSILEPDENFIARDVYHTDGRKQRVVSTAEYENAIQAGFTTIEPAKVVDFGDIPLYLNGNKVVVRNLEDYNKYVALGYNEVQLGPIAQIVKDLGVDRAKASEIKNGTLKVGTNIRGETILTNTATNEVEVLGAAQTSDAATENVTLDEAIANGASINPDSNVNWRTTTTTFQVPETIVDGRVVPAQTIQVTPRMIQEAANLNIDFDDIGDIQSAFGLKGAIAKGVGQLGGLIGQDWQPETNDAIAYLENLRLNTLITLAGTAANGLRDSVWNKQQILTTLAEPGRVWKGAASQYRKLKLTTLEIDKGIEVSMAEINSPTSKPERQAKAKVTLAALQSLKTKYDKVLSVFDEDVTSAPKKQSSYITKTDKDD